MTSPISSSNAVQPTYQAPQRPPATPAASASSPQDTVQLSQKAIAAAHAGDADHDGDSH